MIQDLHDDVVHELLKRGMLKKRGHVRKNWKDRYFVLTVRHLTYYESQTNLTKKVKSYYDNHYLDNLPHQLVDQTCTDYDIQPSRASSGKC